jgi:hypothetical protein
MAGGGSLLIPFSSAASQEVCAEIKNDPRNIMTQPVRAATKLPKDEVFCHDSHITNIGRIKCTCRLELVLDDRKDDRFKVEQDPIIRATDLGQISRAKP